MRVCADCKQVLTDAETVCQRCGSTRLMEYTEDGHAPQPVRQNTSGQGMGQNMGQRRPPMANGMNNMGNMSNGPVGQRPPMQGGMGGQRPPMQRPQGMGQNMGGQRPPMQSMNGMNMNGQNMGGQRPQNMRPGMGGQRPPMQNQGMGGQRPQNMNGQAQNPGVNMQKPVNNMNNMNNMNPGMDNMAMGGQRPVAMTQPVEGDLPPKPDVSSMSPKDAKRVLKEWQKRVDKQAKENKKLAKQQQDAAKKVEALRKKGKPVPPELEQLAAGAAIQASRQRMMDQANGNMDNAADGNHETDMIGATGEVVTMGEWIKFILMTSLIPIYGFILLVLTALGKKDAKESMREFAKAECAIFVAVFVVQIIIQMVSTIIAGMSW